MTIATGTRFGFYEVVAQIGAGGMGEVYEARDTKLGRNVAIKVLPEAFAHDADRLARFQREARALASLNHPNIATIYGLEQSNGTSYLVMELVPGETLSSRIKREGSLPVEEALAIAKQIAEALEAAHEKGIIHRDLKPANVKVTPDGKVKVLDFGLAKAFTGDTETNDPLNSPTLSAVATTQGVILGTAAYMSPEQARGKAVDKRTDIWAFGCVLYELLTSKRAFQGETVTDIIAKILQSEPDWQALPPTIPLQIRTLLRRCLQKDKTLRMRDAGDACIEIQEALVAPAPAEQAVAVYKRKANRRLATIVAVTAVVFLVIGGIAVWNLKPTPPSSSRPITRTIIGLPPGEQLAALDSPAIAISPDGTVLAYVAIHSGTRQIFLRALDSLEAKPLAGTEGAETPFFSPDGKWLGFFAGNKLKKIAVTGGAALTVTGGGLSRGGSWGNNSTIVFATNFAASAVQQVSDAGGPPRPLTRLKQGEISHRWPELLPDNKALLFALFGANPGIVVQSLKSGERGNLVPLATSPHYATTGHLIYALDGNLIAAAFDPERLQLRGSAVPVLDGVLQVPGGGTQYSMSKTGTLACVPGGPQAAERLLVWVNRNGRELALAAAPRRYTYPRISPNGRWLAVTIEEQDLEQQIWLYDLGRDTLTRFTVGGNTNYRPTWTRDSKRLVFTSNREGPMNLFWQPVDGSGEIERLTTNQYIQVARSFSRDGQLLTLIEVNPTTGLDIWMLRLSDRKEEPLLRTQFNESVPSFSPDGDSLAYISDESGRYEVYVQPYPGPGTRYQISTEGGTEPVWNPNGKELFYRSGDKMMAVDIATRPNFSVGRPKVLFQGPYLPTLTTIPFYDVSPDGQRFLMIKPSEQTSSASLNQIVVVQNWFEELKQKVPTGKK